MSKQHLPNQPVPEVQPQANQAAPELQPGGNAFAQDLLLAQHVPGADEEPLLTGGPTTGGSGSDYMTLTDDPALDPLREALNDDSLSFADRTELMVQYRDAQIGGMRNEVDTLVDMREFDPANPMTLTGDKKGMHHNLYAKLADDPKMQAMMTGLADRVTSADPEMLDIDQIFYETQLEAQGLAVEGEDAATTNLRALQAMATLSNFNKFGDKMPPGMDPELWQKIQGAGTALQQTESPNAAVMSHGVPAKIRTEVDDKTPFTADHNYHFFSHAYLTASLMHEHGLDANEAKKVSGLVGAQYELLPSSLGEGQGNSGIKDILMNAEGAAFGADSMISDPVLPGPYEGPPIENRQVEDLHPKDFPEVTEMADEAASEAKWKLFQENNARIVESQPPWAPPFYMQ